MDILSNKHLINAYKEYMSAVRMVRSGLLGNVVREREHLRAIYRLVAGK